MSGSGTLVRALLADDLVDELHLCRYPVTRGDGPRLFDGGTVPAPWSLEAFEHYDSGVLYLRYHS